MSRTSPFANFGLLGVVFICFPNFDRTLLKQTVQMACTRGSFYVPRIGMYFYKYIIEPRHEISNNVVCATSKASDQPAHTRSLIRTFASLLNIL